ncbi:VOC family protein [Mucilaginibacter koreensis]
MQSLTPNIFVRSMSETLAFYRMLGFEVVNAVPPESGDAAVWAMLTCGEVMLMFQTFESLAEDLPQISRQDGGSLLLYIKTQDIRVFFENIKDKVTVAKGLETTFYGSTEFSIVDNNNYLLTFAEDEVVTQSS